MTGPPGGERSGNCYGDIRACGSVLDPIGGTGTNIWFGGVYSITWDGIADAWFTGCDGNPGCGTPCSQSLAWAIDLPPALPGLGLCADLDCTTTACEVWKDQTTVGQCYSTAFGTPCCEGHECTANAFVLGPVCDGSQVWVEIDLNLDGGGRPYRNYSGHAETDPPYEGPGIPRLRDYDLTIDPATWSHACPCETRENPGLCLA